MLARLEGFVAIGEHGQLGRAAAALHLTQPSLTSRLQRLEAELGTPLYRRTRQGMVLTAQGEALLPHARRALEASKLQGLLPDLPCRWLVVEDCGSGARELWRAP